MSRRAGLAMLSRLQVLGSDQDRLFTDAVGLAFFAHVARRYGGSLGPTVQTGALAPWQARRVVEWIDANLDQPMGVDDLAKVVGLSTSYFSRAFLAHAGAPPHRWVMRRKIEHAKRLLSDPNIGILEIAVVCGFVDQGHFTWVFSRMVNQTPARWRRLLGDPTAQ